MLLLPIIAYKRKAAANMQNVITLQTKWPGHFATLSLSRSLSRIPHGRNGEKSWQKCVVRLYRHSTYEFIDIYSV